MLLSFSRLVSLSSVWHESEFTMRASAFCSGEWALGRSASFPLRHFLHFEALWWVGHENSRALQRSQAGCLKPKFHDQCIPLHLAAAKP